MNQVVIECSPNLITNDAHSARKEMGRRVTNSVVWWYGGYLRCYLYFSVKSGQGTILVYFSLFFKYPYEKGIPL